MNDWLIIHNLVAYEQHGDLIGCRIKRSGRHKPRSKNFAEIAIGDKVVYYAARSKVIVGVFITTSKMRFFPEWNAMVIEVMPNKMPRKDYYVDFRKALFAEQDSQFDLFPIKERWYGYLQGQTIRKLTEHDFQIICSYLDKKEYLIDKKELSIKGTQWNRRTRK